MLAHTKKEGVDDEEGAGDKFPAGPRIMQVSSLVDV